MNSPNSRNRNLGGKLNYFTLENECKSISRASLECRWNRHVCTYFTPTKSKVNWTQLSARWKAVWNISTCNPNQFRRQRSTLKLQRISSRCRWDNMWDFDFSGLKLNERKTGKNRARDRKRKRWHNRSELLVFCFSAWKWQQTATTLNTSTSSEACNGNKNTFQRHIHTQKKRAWNWI